MTFFSHLDSVGPVDELDEFSDESVSQIYASHVLEYFDQFEIRKVLQEWLRVLEPGGALRIAVPDFEALVNVYLGSSSLGIEPGDLGLILGPLFGRMEGPDGFIYHRTVWDYRRLSEELRQSGFSDVVRYSPVEFLASIDAKFDDHSLAFLPHFDRNGIQISLCLQATKPHL